MNFLSEEKKAKLSEVLFYVALTIELGIMLLEKKRHILRLCFYLRQGRVYH